MIETKTVLILGAGASVPYGFPTGADLRRDILSTLLTNTERIKILGSLGHDEPHLALLHRYFWRSQQPSIDAFLESRPDFLDMGKQVIAAFLMPKEIMSNLHPEDWHSAETKQGHRLDDHWYRYLFQRMGPTKEQFKESLENISIITFNYDRSFEYYFFETLINAYGLEDVEATQLVEGFQIVHIYGLLAYPHFFRLAEEVSRDYEVHHDKRSIRKAASMINIVKAGEQDGLTREQEKAQKLLKQAERICFIGFGFDLTNLARLDIPSLFSVQQRPQLFGTGYELEGDIKARAERSLVVGDDESGYSRLNIRLANKDMRILPFLKSHLIFD